MPSRSILVFFSLVTLTFAKLELPPELQDYANELHDLCIKRTGITEDDHLAYDIINNPHDEKLQCMSNKLEPWYSSFKHLLRQLPPLKECYIKCLMMEANWMNKDGVIQYEWIEENIHQDIKDIVLTALRKCKNINEGANLCEKASHFNACMYDADRENWFLV